MLIHDMTRQASLDLLARMRFGRLACAHEGQPYISPIDYAYDANHIYSFSMLGRKITWMRANPLVCVEVDEIVSPQNWATVIVFGKYEELPDTPEYEVHRRHAHYLLQLRPVWWEPGYAKTMLHDNTRPLEPLYFRIHIDQIDGHSGVPDATPDREISATRERPVGWLRKILGRAGRKATAAVPPRTTP